MSRIAGLVLAGGILLGAASTSKAQLAISVGNPYGSGLYVGSPGYYGGYGGYGYGAPVTSYYSSGYAGFVAPPVVAPYAYRPYGYGYRGYGYRPYGGYGYGYRGGYGRGFGRRW